MIMFPLSVVTALVYGALGFTAIGVTLLLGLLVRDFKTGRLW